jgi:putative solute:sodium symporter small subunit
MTDPQQSIDNNQPDPALTKANTNAYWLGNLRIIFALLSIWFSVSFGCGILFVEQLNQIDFFGFKFGFWWAQQGSVFVFVVLIFVYVRLMRNLDRRFGLSDEEENHS